MRDHSANTLGAAIKALRDTVTPAVDPSDDQALEQLRLTIDFLGFLKSRLYDLHDRHRYELLHQLELGRAVLEPGGELTAAVTTQLRSAIAATEEALADPATSTRQLRETSETLLGAIRSTVRESRDGPDDVRNRVRMLVLSGLDPLIEMESAWYLPFGFEPDPDSIPDLDSLLRRPL